jgi:hypothetical protein
LVDPPVRRDNGGGILERLAGDDIARPDLLGEMSSITFSPAA